MKPRNSDLGKWIVMAGLVTALAAAAFAGWGDAAPDPQRAQGSVLSLESVKSVLGAAGDFASGAVDMTRDGAAVIVAYRFFDPDRENYETDFATELAPRIQSLYQKFPELNQLRMDVIANDPEQVGVWKPFVRLELDRKTIDEIRWTGFLARYILDKTIAARR
jgi:hypothetical protein